MKGHPDRFHSLDALGGLAAVGVVLWHWQHFFFVGANPPAGFDATAQPLYPVLFLFYERGWLGVDLFFCLSGFLFFWLYAERLTVGAVGPRQFFDLRFSRLYPLHLATLLLVAALQTRPGFVYAMNDVPHFIGSLFMWNAYGTGRQMAFNGPAWYLTVEVLLYALFFLVCRARGATPTVALFLVLVGAGPLASFSEPLGRGLVGFFMGGLVYFAYQRLRRSPRVATIEGALRIATILAWGFALLDVGAGISPAILLLELVDAFPGLGLPLLWLRGHLAELVLFPLTILCLAIVETRGVSFGRFAFLGDASLSIYLLHFPLQLLAMRLLGNTQAWPELVLSPASLAAFMAVLLLVSHASRRWFERPARDWLRRRAQAAGRRAVSARSVS